MEAASEAANEAANVVAIGGSAGSIEALTTIAASLPIGFAAAVLVVVHLPADARSYLPEILSRAGPLPASHPNDGDPLVPGHVYVAPPDRHLLIRDGRMRLNRGPRENGYRPSIDALFRTAARRSASRTIGVLLSGALSDGVAGLSAIKQDGGIAIVQDPSEALFSSMPAGALDRVAVDYTLPAAGIGRLLASLVAGGALPAARGGSEPVPAAMVQVDFEGGMPSVFSCPDCGGVLRERRDGEILRYRCRVGHAYSPGGLGVRQQEHLEAALWAGLRALDENAELSARLAERARGSGLAAAARRFDDRARTVRDQSLLVRAAIERVVDTAAAPAVPDPLPGEGELERERAEHVEQGAS